METVPVKSFFWSDFKNPFETFVCNWEVTFLMGIK